MKKQIINNLNNILSYKELIKEAIIHKNTKVEEDLSTYADAILHILNNLIINCDFLNNIPLTFIKLDYNIGYISLNNINDAYINSKTFEYNINNTIWNTYIIGTQIVMNYMDTILFRSNDNLPISINVDAYRQFKTYGIYSCNGKINSLTNNTDIITDYCFYSLFRDTNIVKMPILSAKDLTNGIFCYEDMFVDCKYLKFTDKLPAENLNIGCYRGMFWGCISLKKSPILPAERLMPMCYEHMFVNCNNLEEIYCNAIYNFDDKIISDCISERIFENAGNTNTIFYKNINWEGPIKRSIDTIPIKYKIKNWII